MSRMRSCSPVLLGACLLVAACAAGDPRFTVESPAGFWFGFWHGLITPITFVIGLFSDHVEIYERANGGSWYDFGFLLGITCFGGCGHRSQRWWRKDARGDMPRGHGAAHVKIAIDYAPQDAKPEEEDRPR